ncbi:MAG: DUF4249 family protein [Bacteroidales bacterium]
MRKCIIITCIIGIIISTSCEKEMQTDKGKRSDLVVRSILTVGRVIELEISRAIPTGETLIDKHERVKSVEVFEDDQLFEILQYDEAKQQYVGNKPVKSQHRYKILITTQENQLITATTYTPPSIDIGLSIDTSDIYDKKITLHHPRLDTLCYFGCFFVDKDSIFLMYEDTSIVYYHMFAISKPPKEVEFANYTEKSYQKSQTVFFQLLDSSMYGLYFQDPEKDFGIPVMIFYTNKQYIGNAYPLTIKTDFYPSTYLYWMTLSPELYIFLRSLSTQNSLQKNNLNNLFSTTNQIVSNVQGAIGFVGSCNIKIIPIYNILKK